MFNTVRSNEEVNIDVDITFVKANKRIVLLLPFISFMKYKLYLTH